ncbi:hypothetical protein JCM6882_007221 [Rhodosporidiobolus microsporus]
MSAQKIIRVGIVGVGEIAQTTHLPTFQLLSHLYKVTALCDVSPSFLKHGATKFGIQKTYTAFSDLIKDPEVDMVMILTADEYHADYAVQAADAGKAVFIEKPMALTHADAKAIIEAEERNKVTIFVGYMRRYAAAYERFKEEVKALKQIQYVTVRDIIGMNHFFVGQSGTFPQAFTDFPPDSSADRAARGKALAEAALGAERASNPRDLFTYRLLGGLGSHDLSAMRELLGVPKRCIAASRAQGEGVPLFISAMFDYGDFTATYESGIDQVPDFDAHIEVIGDGKRLKLRYDTPYVKGLPISIEKKEADSQGHFVESNIRVTYKDAYTLELESLHASLTEGKPVKTGPKDAAQDLIIFDQIMGAVVN